MLIGLRLIDNYSFFAGNTMFFISPFAKIDQAAPLAAKRPPRLIFVPFYLCAAGGAVDNGAHNIQQVSLNGTSCVV